MKTKTIKVNLFKKSWINGPSFKKRLKGVGVEIIISKISESHYLAWEDNEVRVATHTDPGSEHPDTPRNPREADVWADLTVRKFDKEDALNIIEKLNKDAKVQLKLKLVNKKTIVSQKRVNSFYITLLNKRIAGAKRRLLRYKQNKKINEMNSNIMTLTTLKHFLETESRKDAKLDDTNKKLRDCNSFELVKNYILAVPYSQYQESAYNRIIKFLKIDKIK